MIDDLASGKIAVAYNVLGSYADARAQEDGQIEVILPADFPTTMMRTALISKDTESRNDAISFVQHLLRTQSSAQIDEPGRLPPLSLTPGQQTISIEPALMTYLDSLKRQTFIKEWERAIIQ